MLILYILATIFGLYVLLFFILARIFVPFMGFRKYTIPKEIPVEMLDAISKLESESHSSLDYLGNVYSFVQERWHSERAKTLSRLPLIFRTDLSEIWRNTGFAHCTTVNYIFVTLLANSRFFKPEDIQIKHRFFNGVTHQYVKVRVDGKWLDADPSVRYLHLPAGIRSHKLFG